MRYPRHDHYLIFRRTGRDKYNIKHFLTEDEWETSAFYAKFLKALDGKTDPYTIFDDQISAEEVDMLLEDMEEKELLDNLSGVMPFGLGSILIPLWIPKISKVHRIIGALWNRILMITWLPLLIMGAYVYFSYDWEYVERSHGTLIGYLLGFGLGLLFHELSHAFACVGYSSKNRFFEMGIMVRCFMPGAYVVIDYSETKNRFKRAQINAAGIECNMALCGVFLCSLKLGVIDSLALVIAALVNLVIAIINTSLINGIDGMGIFKEIFACDNDLVDRAKKLLRDRSSKNMLSRRGINGRATIAACYIIVFMQVLLPVVVIMNVLAIISMAFM